MKKSIVVLSLLFGIAVALVGVPAYATNGMNLEGYGPVATGMGGASMAYDNGTAAVMNNPATLGLMSDGDRLDVALGYLGPHVSAQMAGMPDAKSSADSFFMPAIGWARKSGQIAYGVGVFAQGGMGTEYGANSFMAAGSGEKVRSEVSVGRLIVPFAYEVNKNLSIAASADFVWAEMDLKMALSGAQFLGMANPGGSSIGVASGSMLNTLGGAIQAGMIPAPTWTRFDFSDDSAYSGKAKGTGLAGKIGAVYKVNETLSIGGTYHSKTNLSDLEANGATLSMSIPGMGVLPVTGKIKVIDFEWPQMIGVGAAYYASDKLMLVADYKWINWADVMKNFKMSFTADATQSNPGAASFGLGGQVVNATLFQNWKDQNVIMVGAGYKVSPEWTARVGVNYANNPIPNAYLNALFPAIETTHITFGAGYMISKASSVDASFVYAPEVKQTSDSGVTSTHYQTNAQVMYSYRF